LSGHALKNASISITSGTVSYAPPVCPPYPVPLPHEVKKTIASRHSAMLDSRSATCAADSFSVLNGSIDSFLYLRWRRGT
jgi:hypothetical protein